MNVESRVKVLRACIVLEFFDRIKKCRRSVCYVEEVLRLHQSSWQLVLARSWYPYKGLLVRMLAPLLSR